MLFSLPTALDRDALLDDKRAQRTLGPAENNILRLIVKACNHWRTPLPRNALGFVFTGHLDLTSAAKGCPLAIRRQAMRNTTRVDYARLSRTDCMSHVLVFANAGVSRREIDLEKNERLLDLAAWALLQCVQLFHLLTCTTEELCSVFLVPSKL